VESKGWRREPASWKAHRGEVIKAFSLPQEKSQGPFARDRVEVREQKKYNRYLETAFA
jgi:hypothetical protein